MVSKMALTLPKEGAISDPCFVCGKPEAEMVENEYGPNHYKKPGDNKLYKLPRNPELCEECLYTRVF